MVRVFVYVHGANGKRKVEEFVQHLDHLDHNPMVRDLKECMNNWVEVNVREAHGMCAFEEWAVRHVKGKSDMNGDEKITSENLDIIYTPLMVQLERTIRNDLNSRPLNKDLNVPSWVWVSHLREHPARMRQHLLHPIHSLLSPVLLTNLGFKAKVMKRVMMTFQ